MNRRQALHSAAVAAATVAWPALAATPLPLVAVYKNPTCGCCGVWVDHLKAAGFPVRVTDVANSAPIRRRHGIGDEFGSCHTAIVGGYAVEGHVPAADIKRLLELKPLAAGIAVPRMPIGSPGMEMDDRKDPFDVVLVDKNGTATVFASYNQPSKTK